MKPEYFLRSKLYLFRVDSLLNLLNSVVMQGATQENSQNLEKLPYTFDFDGPSYPRPSLVFEGVFPNVPKAIMVYKVKDPNITEAFVRDLAQKFDIPADAELKRTSRLGLYWLKTPSHHLEVHPSNGSFNITNARKNNSQKTVEPNLPSKEEIRKIAEEYLNSRNLLPQDAYFYSIEDRPGLSHDKVMRASFRRKIGAYETYGAGAKLRVAVSPDGEVAEVRKTWQQLIQFKAYPIKTPQQALEELQNGQGNLMNGWRGKVNKITIHYYTSPQKQDYVQPIYYFECSSPNGNFFNGSVPAIKQEYLKTKEETIKETEKKGK